MTDPQYKSYIGRDAIVGKALFGASEAARSPLVLDIDGDGVELTSLNSANAVYFDYNNDGYAEKAATVTGGDGLLAIDLNADGIINNASELFGDQTGYNNGFLALAQYDTNADYKITAEDAQWDELRVWIDANANGFSESTELQTLDALNITQINLNYSNVSYQIAGNDIKQESTFVINGATRAVVDAYFAADTVNTVFDQDYTLDPDVLFLPTLRGYGDIADLHIAASIDNIGAGNLKTLLTTFAAQSFANIFAADAAQTVTVRNIMFRWAGVDTVNPGSRGNYADGQELAFLERLMGQGFLQRGIYSNPAGPNAGAGTNEAFDMAFNHFYATLMAQSAAGTLFTGDFFYNIATDSFEGITGINTTTLASLQTEATALANTALREIFWSNVVRMVEHAVGTANLNTTSQTALDNAITASDATLTLAGIVTALAESYTGSNPLGGGAGDDVITGTSAGDLMQGQGGNDTYVYNAGGGEDVIVETGGTDSIVFGAGIAIGNLTFTRAGNTDLTIEIGNGATPGKITIEDYFLNGKGVEQIVFNDLSTFDLAAQNWTLNGTAGQDTLHGVQFGGGNVDTINGGPLRGIAQSNRLRVCAHQTLPRIFARMNRPAANDNLRGAKIYNACNARRRAPLTARMVNDDECMQLKAA